MLLVPLPAPHSSTGPRPGSTPESSRQASHFRFAAYPSHPRASIAKTAFFPLVQVCCIPATLIASSFDDGWRRRGGVVGDGFGLRKNLVEPLHLAPHIVDDATDIGLVLDHARRDEQHQLGPVTGQVLIAE